MFGKTLLSRAAEGGHESIVRLLLEIGKVEVNLIDREDQMPLLRAARGGHESVVKLLLETGKVMVDSTGTYGRPPLS